MKALYKYSKKNVIRVSKDNVRGVLKIKKPSPDVFEGVEISQLQKAIAWAKRRYPGKKLILVPGTYKDTPSVIVPACKTNEVLGSPYHEIELEGIAVSGYVVKFHGVVK